MTESVGGFIQYAYCASASLGEFTPASIITKVARARMFISKSL